MRHAWLYALVVFAAAGAHAVGKGGKLYVKVKEAKLLEKADAKAKATATMPLGAEVTWNGSDAKNKLFHSVEFQGKSGSTLGSNLATSKPQDERLAKDDGKPIDSQAFASSGAATKALSEAGGKYAEGNADLEAIAKGLVSAEAVAAIVTPESAREYAQQSTGGAK